MLAETFLALTLSVSPAAEGPTVPMAAEVCAAERSSRVSVRDAHLAYRDLGPVDGRPVLLIGGTDQQMTQWPDALIEAMQAQGLRPIVYDARDVGCSTHHTEAGPPDWPAIFGALATGERSPLAYHLTTLAEDALAVLDEMGIARADVVGVSGGATVAGELAAAYPDRVGRLVLVMANSGNPARPMPADPVKLSALPPPPAVGAEAEVVTAYRVAAWKVLDGSDTLIAPESRPVLAAAATARSWDPDGIGRTGAALLAAGDRRARLAEVRSPTLVIHGDADPLISVSSGQDVADAVPGARFAAIAGMGHSLTREAVEILLEGLADQAGR